MEAFCDGVVFREAPHQSDGFNPLFKCSGEGLKGSEAGVPELMDMVQECLDMLSSLFFMFHEYSDGVHLLVDGFDGGMLLEDPVSS